MSIRGLIFSVTIAFLLVLASLRVFHNRWADRVWKRIWLVLFVYACVILTMGIIEIVRRSSEGNFP